MTHGVNGAIQVDCTCDGEQAVCGANVPVDAPYFAADLIGPVGVSAHDSGRGEVRTGRSRRDAGADSRRRLRERKRLREVDCGCGRERADSGCD